MDLALGNEPALLPDICDEILPASTIPWFAAVKAALINAWPTNTQAPSTLPSHQFDLAIINAAEQPRLAINAAHLIVPWS